MAPALDLCKHDALQGGSPAARIWLASKEVVAPQQGVPYGTDLQVSATIRQGVRPEVPARKALPGPDTAGWAGLDTYVQLMR